MSFWWATSDDAPTRCSRIGFIGLGAIAQQAIALLSTTGSRSSFTALVRNPSLAIKLPRVEVVATIEDLLAAAPDVVVEAAGHEAVSVAVPEVLARGIPVVISSVGSLADESVSRRLLGSCASTEGRICIPAGAIGGLDYLSALREVPDAAVTYVSRKPPAAWRDELEASGLDAGALAAEYVLFEGAASDAALRFPRNLNVAMTIALAGVGVERTIVRVIADPRVAENSHEIIAQSSLGFAHFCFRNVPSPHNPRTSAVTAHSVVASVHEAMQSASRAASRRPIGRGT